jgi:hypothetical protein
MVKSAAGLGCRDSIGSLFLGVCFSFMTLEAWGSCGESMGFRGKPFNAEKRKGIGFAITSEPCNLHGMVSLDSFCNKHMSPRFWGDVLRVVRI